MTHPGLAITLERIHPTATPPDPPNPLQRGRQARGALSVPDRLKPPTHQNFFGKWAGTSTAAIRSIKMICQKHVLVVHVEPEKENMDFDQNETKKYVNIYYQSINLLSVINKRERASWAARSLVRWRRGQLQRILEYYNKKKGDFYDSSEWYRRANRNSRWTGLTKL
jgi:hypothetical protein